METYCLQGQGSQLQRQRDYHAKASEMSQRPESTNGFELPDQFGCPALRVDLEDFFEFSFEIAESLEDLVATHRSRVQPMTAEGINAFYTSKDFKVMTRQTSNSVS